MTPEDGSGDWLTPPKRVPYGSTVEIDSSGDVDTPEGKSIRIRIVPPSKDTKNPKTTAQSKPHHIGNGKNRSDEVLENQ